MILADKIITLRKKNGWSQEELAEQLGVSRQAVSKWEGAQSTPDLERVLRMAQLFGVSTDYLLKDELEETDAAEETAVVGTDAVRMVTMEEANAFLRAKEETVGRIALGTFLCVLSPIPLLMLAGLSNHYNLSEGAAAAIGITLMLGLALAAVLLFIGCRKKTAGFDYLESEPIDTAYGVRGMVQNERKKRESTHTRLLIAGCCAAILAPVPLLLSALMGASSLLVIVSLCLCILMGGLAAVLFILRGVPLESYQKLLEEGEYTRARKNSPIPVSAINTAFWLLTVAVFLGYSLTTNDWEHSWIIWPVAGVLFAALSMILSSMADRKR
ncbi:MAG: helix-turn-helix transcriptional regulator [Clostridia bacterium]|nr:helix-turn-helix transcriptional regulator [Clostridia bacterium]